MKCYSVLTCKVLMLILIIFLTIGIIYVGTWDRDELLMNEQEMIYEKELPNVEYYYNDGDGSTIDYSDNMAITAMFDCYQKNINLDEVPANILETIRGLEKMYSGNSKYFSFLYQDLFSGFTVAFNADGTVFTASAIKAPAMIYIYEMASLGKVDLNEKLVYTSNYYRGGTGVLKNKAVNTSYTIEELIQYTIYNSDNIAYEMLIDKYGRENIRDFWKEKGTENIFERNTIWGYMSANDAGIYMNELYRFYRENEEYGSRLMEHFKKPIWKLISDKDGQYNTANKGGWSGTTMHDVAIVFDEEPYILAVLSKLGESSYSYLFSETSKRIGKLHEDYWKYKVELCSDIKLY